MTLRDKDAADRAAIERALAAMGKQP